VAVARLFHFYFRRLPGWNENGEATNNKIDALLGNAPDRGERLTVYLIENFPRYPRLFAKFTPFTG